MANEIFGTCIRENSRAMDFFGTLVQKAEKRLDGGREHFLLKEWRLISVQSKKGRNVTDEVSFD